MCKLCLGTNGAGKWHKPTLLLLCMCHKKRLVEVRRAVVFFVLYKSAAATFNAGSESSLLPRKYTLMQKGKKVQTKKNVRYANYLTP